MAPSVTQRHSASLRSGGNDRFDDGDLTTAGLSPVTVAQFAAAMGRSARTVYRWIRGDIALPYPAVRVDAAPGRQTVVLVDPDGWREVTHS